MVEAGIAGRIDQGARISAGAAALVMKPRRPAGGSLVPIRLGHPCVDLDLAPLPSRRGHNHRGGCGERCGPAMSTAAWGCVLADELRT